jgi:hypothetical protein
MGPTKGDTPTENGSDRTDETAKLELPKLSLPRFGRRRKNRDETPVEVEDPPEAVTAREPEPDVAPEASATARLTPSAPLAAEPEPAPEPEPTPAREPVAASPAVVAEEPARPADLYQGTDEPALAPTPFDEPAEDEDELGAEPEPEAEREPFRLPPLPGRLAALITGLVVGAFGSMLTYVSLKGCNALRGTETCGGTGLLVLVVILVLMVLLGSAILAAWSITEPRSTSFLAVGVLCVIVLLTLMQQLFSPWMFLIVPLISAGGYVLSHWVTTAFIEPEPEDGPQHDVR